MKKIILLLVAFMVLFAAGCGTVPVKLDIEDTLTIHTNHGDYKCPFKFKYDSAGKKIEASASCKIDIMTDKFIFRCEGLGLEYTKDKVLDIEAHCEQDVIAKE